MTPTQRSMELLRKEGYHVEVVEKWNSFTKTRKDLWGFVDLLAIRRDEVLGVQVTSGSNISARRRKIADHEHVGKVREAGIRIELHGWLKSDNGRYLVKREDLS